MSFLVPHEAPRAMFEIFEIIFKIKLFVRSRSSLEIGQQSGSKPAPKKAEIDG